jgi:hypothetical protein
MKAIAQVTQYWTAEKGHKGFYYPAAKVELEQPETVTGEIQPWLTPSNTFCMKVADTLIFVRKEDVLTEE